MEHRASMKSFQATRSPPIPLTSFHDIPVLLILSSIVLRHVLFGLPLLPYPRGFQSNAVFSIIPVYLRNVCPIHFLLFIWISIGFFLVILHISSFVNLSIHFIFIIRHLLISSSSAVGHERIELYLYSPYGPYGLHRASVPVQGCTLPLPFLSLGVVGAFHILGHSSGVEL